jgi:hypothetical protein
VGARSSTARIDKGGRAEVAAEASGATEQEELPVQCTNLEVRCRVCYESIVTSA